MSRLKIKMLKDAQGCDEIGGQNKGVVEHFKSGEQYDVCENLGKSFISQKVAELAPKKEAKSLEGAPENKSEKAPKGKASKEK